MIYHNYSFDQLEDFADELNTQYNPKRLTEPMTADVFDIVDLLGARLAIDYLSPDRSYLGATIFRDGCLWIWPSNPYHKGMKPERKLYRAGTIIIDTDLDSSTSEQDLFAKNYTVMHECFHFAKHQASFKHCAHYSKSIHDYGKQQSDHNSALYKIERQADYAAAAFLMPRQAVINAFRERCKGDIPFPFCYEMKPFIKELGQMFGVNYSPMVYRLQDLGLIEKQFDPTFTFTKNN